MVALQKDRIEVVPIADVAGEPRLVPTDSELILKAKAVGTSFG
jgi:hypothetical protein